MNEIELKIINVEDLNMPKNPGRAPQIAWGQDFESWDVKQQNRYLKKVCSALNHATDLIQIERNLALEEITKLNNLVDNANTAVSIQKNIVLKAITDHNLEKQKLIRRLQELEVENKKLTKTIESYEDV